MPIGIKPRTKPPRAPSIVNGPKRIARAILALACRLVHAHAARCVACTLRVASRGLYLRAPLAGTRCSYHYFSFGWLVGGLIQQVARRNLADVLKAELEPPLFAAGVPDGLEERRFAKVGFEEGQTAMAFGSDLDLGVLLGTSAEEGDPEEAAALRELIGSMKDKLYLLDPRIYNTRRVRSACVPAAAGYFSAFELARFYSNLAEARIINSSSLKVVSSQTAMEARRGADDARTRFGLGYQLFGIRSSGGNVDYTCFGHAGVNGALALCDPSRGGFAFAFTCNRMTVGRKPPAREVLAAVLRELALGELDHS